MQNTDINNENINPVNFLNKDSSVKYTSSIGTVTATAATTFQRTHNFSFSSTYTANQFDISQYNQNSSQYNTDIRDIKGDNNFKPISSFTVLNSDDLNISSLIKKPNAIVRPLQRLDHTQWPGGWPERTNLANISESNISQCQHNTSKTPLLKISQYAEQYVDSFAEELNQKLNYLNSQESISARMKPGNFSRNDSRHDPVYNRPLFITTVPTGVFLPPAKEPPLPNFLKQHLYAYSSQPYILNSPPKSVIHFSRSIIPKTTTINSSTIVGDITKTQFNTIQNPSLGNHIGLGSYSPGSLLGGVHLTKHQFQQQLQQNRVKREPPAPEPYKNVMHDRRVIRGTNFGCRQLLVDNDPFDTAAETRRRQILRMANKKNRRNILGTPPPVAGRHHEVVQTDKYLEELFERPPDTTISTQTDLFLEQPPNPPYIPAKIGVDASTEILDGELFNFDVEAQPIIDVLVDACLEQTMIQVSHEKEIEELRKQQDEMLAVREAELAKLRRLEIEEQRLQGEKERRIREEIIAKELDDEMQKSVTAAKLLQGHIASLIPEVLENIEPATDQIKKEELMSTVCPWLSAEVAEEVGQIVDSREILTMIIKEIIKQRAETYADYKDPFDMEIPEALDKEEGMMEEMETETICFECPEPESVCPSLNNETK